jgi:hypothetical protein
MDAAQILGYIPSEKLESLCVEYRVNYQVKKLDGLSMFQLLLYSFLTEKDTSYRVMEEIYHSIAFSKVASGVHEGVRYNSIRDRLTTINADYFESIFHFCYNKFGNEISETDNIVLFDSTLVTSTSKLLKSGMKINTKGDKRYIKFSIGLRRVPVHAEIFTKQVYLSEDIALAEAIKKYTRKDGDIIVFDRGITARKTYESLTENGHSFVTRVNPSVKYNIIENYPIELENDNNGLVFRSDQRVQLYSQNNGKTKQFLRLIICEKEGTPLLFLTNIKELTSLEIANIYKRRWEIEVFFKFIKQQLNFSHLMSRNENGIKIVLYMTLIAAILLTVFKKHNKLKGYKIPKLRLAKQIEALIVRDIVVLCGGNPNKINEFYNSS